MISSDISDRDLLTHRSQFPALQTGRYYFNYGGQGIICDAALDSITRNFRHIEAIGCFSTAAGDWMMQEYDATKLAIAQTFQVNPDTITLTENTTVGCNIAMWAIDWQEGDRLLLSDCEHPGIIACAVQIQKRFGIAIDYFPLSQTRDCAAAGADSETVVELLRSHLQPNTRMVMLSHVCWNTGQVLPLQAIATVCHDASRQYVYLAVDAAQSAGMLPVDLAAAGVDFYAFTNHKWWCAPLGLGALYINPEIFDRIEPVFVGWRGLNGKPPVPQWRHDGAKFEVASSTYALYESLRIAITNADSWGTQQQRYERICQLSQILWQQLNEMPHIDCVRQVAPESGLVSFQVKSSPKPHYAIAKQMESEQQIFIRAIPKPDCLRASVHYLTTLADIEQLVNAIRELETV
ncbi:MAG: aminotransferase class V-fold PLP-dependent enzyme [Pseudanabaenaceae cyanobacterium bins.39]|nr:aminotransferase class V-fold PLP-dependent enzyme [Pseudanabaenaceae cyanobacterium bins.39]